MYVSPHQRYRSTYLKQKKTRKFLMVILGLVLAGLIFSFAVFAWYARDLPSPGKLSQSNSSTVFLDRDGKVLFETDKDKNRVPVHLNEISKYTQEATVSIEDKNFYRH